MNQLRLDPLTGRWIAVSTDRDVSAAVFTPRQLDHDARDTCPFCPGREGATRPALETFGPEGHWLVRVIPNLYPAFEGNMPFVVDHRGPVFTEAPASGIHEVLIFSPDHDLTWASFSDHQCDVVMSAIRHRIEVHQSTPGLRYSQVILNFGREAGASLDHPCGQLLGIPFVPREIVDEQGSFTRFAGGCLMCTATASEERVGYRIIDTTDEVVTFAPYWSRTPYEMLIVPRGHEPHLHRSSPECLAGIGKAIQTGLSALHGHLGDVAYNVIFHSAPYRASAPYHWHVHILPKLTTRMGFELGTGVYINVIAPERAAKDLRNALGDSGTDSATDQSNDAAS
jgi:UDPglucose--hexose-1-phosphate uridylyltransferase